MAITADQILSPMGRPSRPVKEIRAVIRKVAAAQAAEDRASALSQKKATAKKNTASKTVETPSHR